MEQTTLFRQYFNRNYQHDEITNHLKGLSINEAPILPTRSDGTTEDEIQFGKELIVEQCEEIVSILNEYKSCIAKSNYDVKKTDILQLDIIEKDGS